MFPALIAGMGLSAEVGLWYFQQRKLQNAADVAAYAAGVRLKRGDKDGVLDTVAVHVARNSGYTGPTTDIANNPPTSGSYAGDNDAVEVILTETLPRALSSLFIKTDITLSGRAVVALVKDKPACVLALSTTEPDAVKIHGSGDVNLSGCHIASNSTADDAFSMRGGSASLTVDCIHTVGGSDDRGLPDLTECADVDTGISPIADPYDNLPEPTVPGGCSGGGGGASDYVPGVFTYCNGLKLDGTVTLKSGTYIVGKELTIHGDVTGTDVTFFLTNGAQVKVNGGADVNLKAPTTGTYAGVLFFGDPDDEDIRFDSGGNASGSYQGAIYLPKGQIRFGGGSSGGTGTDCMQLIGYTVEFQGNAEFTSNCKNAGLRNVDVASGLKIVE